MLAHTGKNDPEQLQVQAQIDQGQLPGASAPQQATPDAALQMQLAFAQSVFGNVQDLNRTMDQKASSLLGAVGLLTAALGLVASRAIVASAQDDWQRILKGTAILLMVVYLLLVFAIIYVATTIYQARTHRVSAPTTAPGMLFPLMLLDRFSVAGNVDETAYLSRLRTLQTDDVLQDYAYQIIEVSIIYREKQQQVNLGLRLFRWTGFLWLVTMLVVVVASVVLP